MSAPLVLLVSDLIGRPEATREERISASVPVAMDMATVEDEVAVFTSMKGSPAGVIVSAEARFAAVLSCHRCLDRFRESRVVELEHHFDDESEPGLQPGGWIDLEPLLRNEVVLSLPLAPLCGPECLGLCAECGTDLNRVPCGGHPEESDSPFAALEALKEVTDP